MKDLVLLKWAILSKEIYRSKAIPITISSLFCGNGKADPQIHMEFQRALNGQNNLRKEHRWKTLISRFQKLTKATMNKTVWYWHKNRHIHQWNRIRSQEISQTYMAKWFEHSVGKEESLQQLYIHINLDPHLTPYAKLNSKWSIT